MASIWRASTTIPFRFGMVIPIRLFARTTNWASVCCGLGIQSTIDSQTLDLTRFGFGTYPVTR